MLVSVVGGFQTHTAVLDRRAPRLRRRHGLFRLLLLFLFATAFLALGHRISPRKSSILARSGSLWSHRMIKSRQLANITRATLEHYDERADEFRRGTCDHDVSQNIAELLRHIEGSPPFEILDFGCGPGRDLKAFAALGHVT